MQTPRPLRPAVVRTGRLAVLTLLVAGLWWGWFAWDDSYQHDPATGEASDPSLWQAIGCAASGILLIIVAERLVPSPAPGPSPPSRPTSPASRSSAPC
ncbi:hypothetical protein GCM10027060_13680 [Nesterenkonia halophila]